MSALIAAFLSNPTALAIGGGVIAALVAFMKGRTSGAARERQKQATERLKARAEADRIDDELSRMEADELREELAKWSKR